MSYRIIAKNAKGTYHQVYGNNEFPQELIDYLLERGCKFNGDNCFRDFKIPDIQEFLEVMVKAHQNYMVDDSYWDFKPTIFKDNTPHGLINHCQYKTDYSYAYIVYNFYDAFRDQIKEVYEGGKEFYKYKDNSRIYLSGG